MSYERFKPSFDGFCMEKDNACACNISTLFPQHFHVFFLRLSVTESAFVPRKVIVRHAATFTWQIRRSIASGSARWIEIVAKSIRLGRTLANRMCSTWGLALLTPGPALIQMAVMFQEQRAPYGSFSRQQGWVFGVENIFCINVIWFNMKCLFLGGIRVRMRCLKLFESTIGPFLSLHGLGNFRIPDSFAAFPELVSEWWRVFARHRANHWPRSRSKRAFVYFLLVWSHALKKYWTHFQQLLCCLA